MRIRDSAAPVSAARSEGLLIEHVGDETVVYDLESKEAHCLKAVAAFVFAQADGQRSVREIAELASVELGEEVTEQQVQDAVDQLEQVSLIDRPLVVLDGNGDGNGVSRREMIRRVGFTGAAAAVGTTMITSIVAPSVAFAQSGIPPGCTGCSQNKDCTSGHCCQNNAGKSCNQSCCVDNTNSCHTTDICTGGTNNGTTCTSNAQCTGGGTCVLSCTVCQSLIGNCPTPQQCAPNAVCCSNTC